MGRKTYRKQITTPELIEQISPKNKKIIKLFLKDKDRKCSAKTIVNYESDLNIFFCWNILENENAFYPEIKKAEISDFFSYCVDELKWHGQRFARMKSVLSGLSDTVIKYYDDDYPTFKNIINNVIESIPKQASREKTVLEEKDINKLFQYFEDNRLTQQACFLSLAINSGMRISELVQMKKSYIDYNSTAYNDLFLKTTSKMRTKGAGKEGKVIYRYVLKQPFIPYFEKWVKERENILKDLGIEDHDSLFIKLNGEPATENVFRGWTENWEKIINQTIYIHAFRHYCTTTLKTKYKCSDVFIQKLIQWESVDMVSRYTDTEAEDMEWEELTNIKNQLENK